LKRLREDDRKSSDGSLFNSLAPYLWGDKGNKKWADVARELSMAEGTVRVAASRLRQKYREAVREVIRETVIDPAEVDSEMTYLISVLGAS
jgi:RNA polymerase sigma-70 factor (ECF subfamily)